MGELIGELGRLAFFHSWLLFTSFLIGLCVRLLKTELAEPLFAWLPSKYRVLVAIFLGQVGAVLESVSRGTGAGQAVLNGLLASALAVLGHDLFIETARGGKELFDLSGKKQQSADK